MLEKQYCILLATSPHTPCAGWRWGGKGRHVERHLANALAQCSTMSATAHAFTGPAAATAGRAVGEFVGRWAKTVALLCCRFNAVQRSVPTARCAVQTTTWLLLVLAAAAAATGAAH